MTGESFSLTTFFYVLGGGGAIGLLTIAYKWGQRNTKESQIVAALTANLEEHKRFNRESLAEQKKEHREEMERLEERVQLQLDELHSRSQSHADLIAKATERLAMLWEDRPRGR